MPRKQTPNPNQGELFQTFEVRSGATDPNMQHTHIELVPAEDGIFGESTPTKVVEGVSTDVQERRLALSSMLGKLAQVSRANGFMAASEYPNLRKDIEDTYGAATKEVTQNVQNKRNRQQQEIPEEFARLYNIDGLVEAGLTDRQSAERDMAQLYREFESWFGGSKGAGRREAMKSWLNYGASSNAAGDGPNARKRPRTKKFPKHPKSQ